MAGVTISLRLPEELLAWADAYAKTCGCTRTDLIAKGLCLIRESGPDDEPVPVAPAGVEFRRVEEEKAREEARSRVQRAVAAAGGQVRRASELPGDPGGHQGRVNKMIDRARGAK